MQLPIREVAERFGVSVDTIRRRLRAGQMQGDYRNGKWWIEVDPDAFPAPKAPGHGLETTVGALVDQLRVKDEQIARLLDLLRTR